MWLQPWLGGFGVVSRKCLLNVHRLEYLLLRRLILDALQLFNRRFKLWLRSLINECPKRPLKRFYFTRHVWKQSLPGGRRLRIFLSKMFGWRLLGLDSWNLSIIIISNFFVQRVLLVYLTFVSIDVDALEGRHRCRRLIRDNLGWLVFLVYVRK
jgi:hypothetical protein